MTPPFLKFRDDNVMTLRRTPWAGSRIARCYCQPGSVREGLGRIGESWEFSFDAVHPSRCHNDDRSFPEMAAASPGNWLSSDHVKCWGVQSPLLIKVIDADMPLSVQLHPPLVCDGLRAGECGKWEAWYILQAGEGAGIYLGFRPGIDVAEAAEAITRGASVRDVLQFIPVRPGEMYCIAPGVIHALGAGVCVLEPQIIQPGRTAVTLRLYDWDRRYDSLGRLDPAGAPRELRTKEIARWFVPLRNVLPPGRFRIPQPIFYESERLSCRRIFTAVGLIMYVIRGSGEHLFNFPGELKSIIVLQGSVACSTDNYNIIYYCGEAGVISAAATSVRLDCNDALCFVTCVAVPAEDGLSTLYKQEIISTLKY